MLAGIRDVTPRARLGTTIAVFGASGPIGFAAGPVLAGILIDGFGLSLPGVFAAAAVLSLATAALVTFGSREIRPEVVPTARVATLALGAMRGVLTDPAVRRVFLIFGVSYLASQMTRPYIPVLVEGLSGTGPGLASSIGLVAGTAALVGAVGSPLGGVLGDRIGFRPVLIAALAGAGLALLVMPLAPSVASMAIVAVVLGTATATVTAMIFGLLAVEVPAERRSATLNLVYLPLYAAGILGPATAAGVAAIAGATGPFGVGGAILLVAAVVIALGRSRSGTQPA
jgi:DHA1 family multidrug resistance protein-like MFS transporter